MKSSGAQLKTRLQLMCISKLGGPYLEDSLGTVQKRPQGTAHAGYEPHSLHLTGTRQRKSRFHAGPLLPLKIGFVIISYYRLELCCYKIKPEPSCVTASQTALLTPYSWYDLRL